MSSPNILNTIAPPLYPNGLLDSEASVAAVDFDNELMPLSYSLFPWLMRQSSYPFNLKPTLRNKLSRPC